MDNTRSGDANREARGGPASGFPLPPDQPGPAREVWRDRLDHWRAELDYRRIIAEHEKLRIETKKVAVEERKIDQQWFVESSKAAFDFARAAIGHAILINGGAAIAILAHLGTSSRNGVEPRVAASALALPLELLGAGLVSACLSGAAAYISQSFYTHDYERLGDAVRGVAVLLWFGSVGSFAYAVWLAAQAIR